MTLGEIIKQERQKQGHTQDDLARVIGVSRHTIINWEKGKTLPDSQSLVCIAERYGLSFDELIGLKTRTKQRKLWKKYALLLAILSIGCFVNISNNTFIPLLVFVLLLVFLIQELGMVKSS